MIEASELAKTVQLNCHISDAKYAGYYSMCVFLLKMREYYRWEQNIPLSQTLAKSDVGQWLSQRELDWQDYENQAIQPLTIGGQSIDAFETTAANQLLNSEGYVYSGGYGIFNKPHFFLAELQEIQNIDGYNIFISDKEIARDLVAPPAMIVGQQIFIRKESLRRYIWQKIEEWRWKSDDETPMARALSYYHKSDIEKVLNDMSENECHSAMLHELGEAKATEILGSEWKEILSQIPHSGLQLKLRAIKDHIADTISTIPGLLQNENFAALHFYFANFTGMRREIYPEAIDAYNEWVKTKNLTIFEKLCDLGKNKWIDIATEIKQNYLKDQEIDANNVELLLTS